MNKEEKIKIPEYIKKFVSKKNAPLFIIGIVGILLIFLSEFSFTSAKPSRVDEDLDKFNKEYVGETEEKLRLLVEKIEGAGRADVMITLESGSEKVYAKAEKQDSDLQEDGTEKERISKRSSYESDYVIIEDESGTPFPIMEKQMEPVIKGVAVICEGGGNDIVVAKVTELLSVVLGVSYNRVCVAKMQS